MRPGRDEQGRPIVHTSYRIAYAFDPGDRKALVDAYDVVAMVRTDTDFQLTDQGLDVLKSEGFSFAMACEAAKDGYLAPMFTEPQPTGGQTFSLQEGFAADAPLDGGASCG